ncbi:ACT domain-containing protein ACR3-like [Phalaenopsis equestris]|uniref:ACT domain-containing protein ACR3-like n=1 Tax=Phalaenopsis equestris TaxID=78828 RepID=UPI0009E3D60C|nr:ACT domain-containing protein ACR3-like [Phalaenopsis equestris]
MVHGYPYFEPDFVHPSEYIPPLEVCIDNETSEDVTLIKINGAKMHNILLKIVQILSDLDLIISKSNISSHGDWFMHVFHVTNQHGHKLNEPTLICYIQHSLNITQKKDGASDPPYVKISHGMIVNFNHFAVIALELCFLDRPNIFSEVVDVLSKYSYVIDSGELWTHNGRVACIIYIKKHDTNLPIFYQERFDYLGDFLASLMKTHHFLKELWEVRLRNPLACRIHTERRLHQLLQEYKDYEIADKDNTTECPSQVSIESWKERDCLVVNVKSKDRPKLMYDTLCALTNLNYEVFQGFTSTKDSVAVQVFNQL